MSKNTSDYSGGATALCMTNTKRNLTRHLHIIQNGILNVKKNPWTFIYTRINISLRAHDTREMLQENVVVRRVRTASSGS